MLLNDHVFSFALRRFIVFSTLVFFYYIVFFKASIFKYIQLNASFWVRLWKSSSYALLFGGLQNSVPWSTLYFPTTSIDKYIQRNMHLSETPHASHLLLPFVLWGFTLLPHYINCPRSWISFQSMLWITNITVEKPSGGHIIT